MGTIVVGLVVAACILAAIRSVYQSGKKGSSCGCDCSSCHKCR